MPIHFGTDGWRAVISDEFTFANLRHVAQAIADHVREQCNNDPPKIVIGFDTRFLSDRYAIAIAEVLAGNGIVAYLSKSDCPTPALSFGVRQFAADGGVMITASHNAPRYNGVKVKASHGGSAPTCDMKRIEEHLAANLGQAREPIRAEYEEALSSGAITRVDLLPFYLQHLRSLVDLDLIAASNLRVVVDPMYGAGRGYIKAFLEECRCGVTEIRAEMNPGFAGIYPEPIERNLGALVSAVRQGRFDVGLATDGDADRIGAVDADGRFVDPHRIFALVLRHLVEQRGWTGDVVKTISTTQMIDVLAARYGLTVHETPVGFSHICERMLANDVLIGGEESGGITIKGHVPEGDGILMGLLLLEVMAAHRKPLRVILDELMAETGPFHYARHDVETKPFSKAELVARLANTVPSRLADIPVREFSTCDGAKYLLQDDSWLLIRPSGTEPVLRIYAEARTEATVARLLDEGRQLAGV